MLPRPSLVLVTNPDRAVAVSFLENCFTDTQHCMEPWNGWANSVNEEGKHEVLEPDEALTSEWTITIEKV